MGACQTLEILGDVDAAVACIERYAGQADRWEIDLLLFPECFLQGYLVEPAHVSEHALDLGSGRFAQVLRRLAGLAQNMMRRAAATRWKYEHHRIRCERARETGMWLISADVTGARDADRVGYGPTSVINPYGEVVAQVPLMTTCMVVADIP